MRMIAFAFTGLLFVFAPADAPAQQMMRGDLAAATDSILNVYATQLNLTDEQQAEIREVLMAQGEKSRQMFEEARSGGREAMMEMRPKFAEMQKETDAQIETLLTEDQIPGYRQIRLEMDAQRRERRRQRQPGR